MRFEDVRGCEVDFPLRRIHFENLTILLEFRRTVAKISFSSKEVSEEVASKRFHLIAIKQSLSH